MRRRRLRRSPRFNLNMLAWLQRLWVIALVVLAAAVAWYALQSAQPWWLAALLALAVLNAHAFALALEFVWLRAVDPGPGIPKPPLRALASAWWGEVLTGLTVFGWRQPFRSRALHDALPASSGRRGVLLVHGFVCNRGLWNPWMTRLGDSGTPYVAVNLEPVFGSIDRYVRTIDTAIRQLELATGTTPVIVAHSMGGLAVRAWLREHAADRRVHSVVTIGTPHAGTLMARFAMSDNARQMRQGSAWLRQLEASESRDRRSLFTCYFGHCDNIVFPARNATLPDAVNCHVSGIAHVHLAFHGPIFDDVLRRTAS